MNMKINSTYLKAPLDRIILELSAMSFNNPNIINPLISLIQQQLLLLRTLHIEMLENDFYEIIKSFPQGERKIDFREVILNKPVDSNRAVLNYLSFLSVLNQFGRALHHNHNLDLLDFPSYYRVRFYRNKVGEHWEEYISYFSKMGVTFTKGKSAIPLVEEVINPKEKQKIAKQLKFLFKENGIKEVPFLKKYSGYNAISSIKDYSNSMYKTLELLDKRLRKDKIPDNIIVLLFQFGFPAPIYDLEEYLVQLSDYLNNMLNLESISG